MRKSGRYPVAGVGEMYRYLWFDDILMLPMGRKITKGLAKFGLIE